MNHQPQPSGRANAPLLTSRQAAKQRTRVKLLGAARALFAERGYEAATVRDIAAAANLSTGAVFASFADKADLFNEVIVADFEMLYELMRAVPDDEGPIRDRLLDKLTLAYEAQMDQLRLVQAVLSFSWTRDIRTEGGGMRGHALILDHFAALLRRGIDSGEFSPALDVRLTSEMLWDSYLSNYRRAIFDGWDKHALRERLSSQIDILLCASRAAA